MKIKLTDINEFYSWYKHRHASHQFDLSSLIGQYTDVYVVKKLKNKKNPLFLPDKNKANRRSLSFEGISLLQSILDKNGSVIEITISKAYWADLHKEPRVVLDSPDCEPFDTKMVDIEEIYEWWEKVNVPEGSSLDSLVGQKTMVYVNARSQTCRLLKKEPEPSESNQEQSQSDSVMQSLGL